MTSDLELPLLPKDRFQLFLKTPFKSWTLTVERIIKQRPVAIVLLVRWNNTQQRVVKLYPIRSEVWIDKSAFLREREAYKSLESSPGVAPRYFGQCSATVIYPPECTIPSQKRLKGPQYAIVLEYLDAEDLMPENLTLDAAFMAAESFRTLHRLGIHHGDSADHVFLRNIILLKNGEVRWLDFERAGFHIPKGFYTNERLEVEYTLMKALRMPDRIRFGEALGLTVRPETSVAE
ncbi:hypothetical protein DL96DRAFT_1816033 [Flagelloscypha sp. PMI_526]|nr:hypothetical protein DL96DRAFT_1816033 [Flagelloscypha sp. PMI_526]